MVWGRHCLQSFREFSDVLAEDEGAGRMPLIPEGDQVATSDAEIAQVLFLRKLEELRERKRTGVATGIRKRATLAKFAASHLERLAASGSVPGWVKTVQNHLEEAVRFFGVDRDLSSIETADVQRYREHLEGLPSGRGRRCPECAVDGAPVTAQPLLRICSNCSITWQVETISTATQRKYLNSLGKLFRRAIAEGYVRGVAAGPKERQPGNPVHALMDKPVAAPQEAEWLTVADAALLLEAARTYEPKRDDIAIPAGRLHAIIATFLLTGGRKSEVLGLTIEDVSFDLGKVFFRPHQHRRLKTKTSRRWVPLWPQLRDVLVPYVESLGDVPPESLLFPSTDRGSGGMIRDLRKALDAVAKRAGWKGGEIRTKMFRHTYASTRIQTHEHGAPVSVFTVSRELGHSSTALIERTYGHLADRNRQHRAEVVEYRVDQHRKHLAPRLQLLEVA
jgi:integrase